MLGLPGPLVRLLRWPSMWLFARGRHARREGSGRRALPPLGGIAAASAFVGAALVLGTSGVARADGVIAGGDLLPVDQRVAIAVARHESQREAHGRQPVWEPLRA